MAIQDNSIKTTDSIDVYTDKIYYYADEYISSLPNPEDIRITSKFTGMLLYISRHITKIPHEDIRLLDSVFDIYIDLCCRYDKLPTLEMFSVLVDIDSSTFTNWMNGTYRAQSGSLHLTTAKKWREKCKNFLINDLQNSSGTNVNKIFIAKAAYGMAETAPVQVQAPQQTAAIEDIQARYKEISAVNDDSFYSANVPTDNITNDNT